MRVRCPVCRKLIKNLDTVERLPLNINILYEIVEKDDLLRDLNFEETMDPGFEAESDEQAA